MKRNGDVTIAINPRKLAKIIRPAQSGIGYDIVHCDPDESLTIHLSPCGGLGTFWWWASKIEALKRTKSSNHDLMI